eukprot:gene5640-6222_t
MTVYLLTLALFFFTIASSLPCCSTEKIYDQVCQRLMLPNSRQKHLSRTPDIFNATFYASKYSSNTSSVESDAGILKEHFTSIGMKRGYLPHDGKKIVKIVVNTRNEWPLIRDWVLYHGEMIGFEHLYIVDNSDEEEVINFLHKVADKFGVNVFFTKSFLTSVYEDVHCIFRALKGKSDLLMKVDSDEFLVVHTTPNNKLSENRNMGISLDVAKYLETLTFDGCHYRTADLLWVLGDSNVCETKKSMDKTTTSVDVLTRLSLAFGGFKHFFSPWTFVRSDIGSHLAESIFNCRHITSLTYVHYHFRCYDNFIRNSMKGVISRGYLFGNESTEIARSKLEPLSVGCQVSSCHKVHAVYRHLKNPETSRIEFYKELESHAYINSTIVRDQVRLLRNKYSSFLI